MRLTLYPQHSLLFSSILFFLWTWMKPNTDVHSGYQYTWEGLDVGMCWSFANHVRCNLKEASSSLRTCFCYWRPRLVMSRVSSTFSVLCFMNLLFEDKEAEGKVPIKWCDSCRTAKCLLFPVDLKWENKTASLPLRLRWPTPALPS